MRQKPKPTRNETPKPSAVGLSDLWVKRRNTENKWNFFFDGEGGGRRARKAQKRRTHAATRRSEMWSAAAGAPTGGVEKAAQTSTWDPKIATRPRRAVSAPAGAGLERPRRQNKMPALMKTSTFSSINVFSTVFLKVDLVGAWTDSSFSVRVPFWVEIFDPVKCSLAPSVF